MNVKECSKFVDSPMKDNPLVSVIIPVYNGEKYLAAAIESVLSQSYHPVEVSVVDDGSNDGSQDIALSYPQVKTIHQENAGPAAARNRGLQVAKGEYIAFLDADDLWMPDKLTLQIAAFTTDPELGIVTGYVEEFNCPESDIGDGGKNNSQTKPLPGYIPSAILVKRDTFEIVGPFHDDFHVGEVISWFSTVLESGIKIKVLPNIIARRRIHGRNISTQFKEKKNQAILNILKESLDRRRANPKI